MWRTNNNSSAPDFMNNYLQCRYLNPLNISNPITTNIVISDDVNYKQINPQYSTSCYIQDILSSNDSNHNSNNILVNNDEIKQEIVRKCEKYSISNASAVIHCGQETNTNCNIPSLNKNVYKKDYCYAVIFDDNYLNNECNNNLYGFKVDLPIFTNTICDDMIYSESINSIIGYQTFYNRFNSLYYLNPDNSNWELLTKINWKSNGFGSMIEMVNDHKLFISTDKGESVLLNMDLNNITGSDYIRLPTLNISGSASFNIDNSLDFEYFDFDTFYKPQKPVFGYNEFYKKMYRLNMNKNSENENYHFDFFQNKWVKMDLINTLKCNKSKLKQSSFKINDQSLWSNDQNPNILYSMINSNYDSNKDIIFAYFDERDYSQKQWNIIPESKIKKHSKSFSSNNNDFIVSMF